MNTNKGIWNIKPIEPLTRCQWEIKCFGWAVDIHKGKYLCERHLKTRRSLYDCSDLFCYGHDEPQDE